MAAHIAIQRAAASTAAPAPGTSYTWSVRSSNGDVYWYNNTWSFEGVKTLKSGGTITFALTAQAQDDNAYTPFTGPVWYGNFSIYHPAGDLQVLNWSKPGCSTTEIGMNLALSALSWCGGLVAPADWVANKDIILSQPADDSSYQVLGNQAFVHYEYSGQVTDLVYDMPTGLLVYANTTMFGFWLDVALGGYSPSAAIPGAEPILTVLVSGLVVAIVAARMNKSGKRVA
ncbi:MAG: hypothetical protein JW839_05090 [Candidatus Lokiarchaeota archaeon]|nr:hypothetical protein [Candidatus Lokiarchaeota archaeon]